MATMEQQADEFRERKRRNQLLLVAAARGYAKDVEALLDMGAAPDCKDKKGLQPLHFAAGRGRSEVVKFLWSKGAEVDAEMPDGKTPLHLAAASGHAEAATFLLQKGAWADAYDSQDSTPLHLAARHGHTSVIDVLLKHGAKPGLQSKHGLTPVAEALLSGHTDAVKLLLSWGGDLQARPHGYGLLHLAAGVGQLASVQLLLDMGADANDQENPEQATPLHSAVLGDSFHCAEALLKAGADASLADGRGRLPAGLPVPQSERLRALLARAGAGGSGARRTAAKTGSSGTPNAPATAAAGAAPAGAAAPMSAQEKFQSLSAAEQRSKVERWVAMGDEDLAAALRDFPADAAEEVRRRVGQLQSIARLMNIQKALAALHEDEEFQADASQAHVREAIEALRADPSQYERYASDPQILAVLQKMRRMHSVAQANGQRTISIEEMVLTPGGDWQQQDARRLAALRAGQKAELAAAVAAAAADQGQAAAAATAAQDAALAAIAKEEVGSAAGRPGASGPAAAAAAAAGKGGSQALPTKPSQDQKQKQEDAGGHQKLQERQAVKGRGRQEAEAAARVMEKEEREARARARGEEDLPEWMKGEFSWKKVWREFLNQCRQALLVLLAFACLAAVVALGARLAGYERTTPAQAAAYKAAKLAAQAAAGAGGALGGAGGAAEAAGGADGLLDGLHVEL